MSGNRVLCGRPGVGAWKLAERWHLHSVGGGNTASKGMGEVFFKIIWVYSNQ